MILTSSQCKDVLDPFLLRGLCGLEYSTNLSSQKAYSQSVIHHPDLHIGTSKVQDCIDPLPILAQSREL